MRRRTVLSGLMAAAAAACSKTPARPKGLTRIRFATDWKAQAEHGGFYQALATGEYRRRGLDVQIVPGGPGVNVPQLLAGGAAELGMCSNNFIALQAVAAQAPLTVVAAYFQKDPQVLIAHPDPSLKGLADLKGRPILLADASINAFWVWLKAKYGFTDDQVRKYNYSLAPFLADKRAVVQGYLTSEPYSIQQEGHIEPRVFLLADEGYPSYATMVFAPDSLIAAKPDAVRAFVEASAKGWTDYLNGDAKAANAMILKDNPDMKPDVLDQARAKLKSYGLVDGGDARTLGVGAMTDARWEAFFKVASAQGVFPPTLDWKKAYTLQFVTPKPA